MVEKCAGFEVLARKVEIGASRGQRALIGSSKRTAGADWSKTCSDQEVSKSTCFQPKSKLDYSGAQGYGVTPKSFSGSF